MEENTLSIERMLIPHYLLATLSDCGTARDYVKSDDGGIKLGEQDDLRVAIELNDGTKVMLPKHSVIYLDDPEGVEKDTMVIEYPRS